MSAQRTLERLLERAENAVSRGASSTVSLLLSAASCPEYARLQTLDEFDAYHGQMTLAERSGCVALEWTRAGGDSRGLRRVTVKDHQALAAFLGSGTRQAAVEAARAELLPYIADFPVLDTVLERWRMGKPVRGCGPAEVVGLRDALRVAMDASRQSTADRVLRSESVRLFGDSKRIEQLTAWLDLLSTGDTVASGLAAEDVWAQFGLRRTPQPFLMAGAGAVTIGSETIPLVRPYLGLPTDAVTQLRGAPAFVLSIENLATFHETLRVHPAHEGWVVYTAGMPSPAWQRVYALLLSATGVSVPVYHWGDIDEGGFRIAALLQRRAGTKERRVLPWLMSPAHALRENLHAMFRTGTPDHNLIRFARSAGWESIACEFEVASWRIEQEALHPQLPTGSVLPVA